MFALSSLAHFILRISVYAAAPEFAGLDLHTKKSVNVTLVADYDVKQVKDIIHSYMLHGLCTFLLLAEPTENSLGDSAMRA